MSAIQYKDINIYQGKVMILGGISFDLQEGDFAYLTGKVGSGKSTLLKTLYGELEVEAGFTSKAKVLGISLKHMRRRTIPKLRRQIGIIFQDFQLLTDRSVYNNLYFVLRATGWTSRKEMRLRISEVLQMVGMETKQYKMPHELSGGEVQRICIARALLNKPGLILADEPTANLDPETSCQIVEILRQVASTGTAILMSTHNTTLIEKYPGRIFECSNHTLKEIAFSVPASAAIQESVQDVENNEETEETEETE